MGPLLAKSARLRCFIQVPDGVPMRLVEHIKKRKESAFIAFFFLLFWIVLFILIWIGAIPVETARTWFELFNGATWPTEWSVMQGTQPGWFSFALATRTVLNFAGPFAVLATFIWLLFGGLERVMKMSKIEVLKMHNAELVGRLAFVLNQRHPHLLDKADLIAMQDAADQFTDEWAHDEPVARDVLKEEATASSQK